MNRAQVSPGGPSTDTAPAGSFFPLDVRVRERSALAGLSANIQYYTYSELDSSWLVKK